MKLGQHRGFPYYTIGQRKGLEIALGKPAYVLKINPQKNTVMLGDAEQLKAGYMVAEQDNIVDEDELFLAEASAIAPGQSAVFYDGRRVIGGAFIASQRGIGLVIEQNKNWE